jgi:surfeit locus 1 family protein
MFLRMILPMVFGIGGFAVLVGLGLWQLDRQAWKEAILAEIEGRITADPVALPAAPDPTTDRYLPVAASGAFSGTSVKVLVSTRDDGAGYRIVSAFLTGDGRRIMVDEGFVPDDGAIHPGAATGVTVTGNLHWPDEVDRWTPEPDMSEDLFFARDVPAMAAALGAEPVLIVARAVEGVDPRARPMPVGVGGIPNNHFGYAVQWFGMAAVWAGMTVFLLWRIRRRTD